MFHSIIDCLIDDFRIFVNFSCGENQRWIGCRIGRLEGVDSYKINVCNEEIADKGD